MALLNRTLSGDQGWFLRGSVYTVYTCIYKYIHIGMEWGMHLQQARNRKSKIDQGLKMEQRKRNLKNKWVQKQVGNLEKYGKGVQKGDWNMKK